MESLEKSLSSFIDSLTQGAGSGAKRAVRVAEVKVKWENAVRAVYGPAADLILDHVNAVYILAGDVRVKGSRVEGRTAASGETQLVVYADDSLVRSDLDAKQEFLKLRMREQGENIGIFHVIPSRFDMKDRHPFRKEEQQKEQEPVMSASSLSEEEFAAILKKADEIEDPAVRESFKRAVEADFRRCAH